MDFLFIAPIYHGGVGKHAAMLAGQLQKAGHTVDLFRAPHVGVKNFKNPSFAIFAALKMLTNKKRYDIAHAFNVPSALPMHYVNSTARVLSIYGVYGEQMGMIHSKTAKILAEFAERKSLKWADMLTTDSKRTAEKYSVLGYEFRHMLSAIDITMFEGIGPVKKHPSQVVYVGRDSYEKGTDILRRIEQDIQGTVRYCTNLKWQDAMSVLAESSVLVLPSRMESSPTVIKEAFYLKVPVVAMSVGGVPELVQDGVTGFLTNDEHHMTSVINGILDGSIPTSEIVQSAYKYVTCNLTWDVVTPQYEKMYTELLASCGG